MPESEPLDSLLRLIKSSGGLQVSIAPGTPPEGWTVTGMRSGLQLAVPNQLSNSELIAVRDEVATAFRAADQVAEIGKENVLLADQLDALLAVLETDTTDDTAIPSMFGFLPLGSSLGILKAGEPLYAEGIDHHSLRIEARRMETRFEHRCDIANGERFVYRSDPYVAIVDSLGPLDQIRRRLVRLTLAQLATHQHEREQHELLERVRTLIAAEHSGSLSGDAASGDHAPSDAVSDDASSDVVGPEAQPQRGSEPSGRRWFVDGQGPGSPSSVESDVSRLIEATVTDSLTRVYNRSKTTSVIDSLTEQGRDYSIVMADIDRFKSVNDTFGHQAGDRVIVAVAACLDGDRRPDDVVARWGGEEFIAVLPDMSIEHAMDKAERWRATIASTVTVGKRAVTCSFGVAQWSAGKTADQLMAEADSALYRAKNGGRNRVEADSQLKELSA